MLDGSKVPADDEILEYNENTLIGLAVLFTIWNHAPGASGNIPGCDGTRDGKITWFTKGLPVLVKYNIEFWEQYGIV